MLATHIVNARATIYEELGFPGKAKVEYRYLCEKLKDAQACKNLERLKERLIRRLYEGNRRCNKEFILSGGPSCARRKAREFLTSTRWLILKKEDHDGGIMNTRSRLWYISGTLFLAVFFSIGASAAGPTYKGKTAERWVEMLSHPDSDIRSQAFDELTQADQSGGEVLVVFLGESHPNLRSIAVLGLRHMAPAYPAAIPALTKAVLDVNLNVRYWALSALKEYGKEAGPAVPNIIKALETFQGKGPALDGPARYYADARALAADALGSIGPDAKAAIPALEIALQDPSPMVRESAKRAIKSIKGL